MSNVNTVAVSGNLTRDPEYKQINEDFAVAKLGIAVNRNGKKNDDGSYEEKVSFFDVEVLGSGFAALVGRKMKKGDSATITGRLEQQTWTTDDGNRSKVVIIATEIDSEAFFRSKDEDNPLDGAAPAAAPAQTPVEAQVAAAVATDDDIPF